MESQRRPGLVQSQQDTRWKNKVDTQRACARGFHQRATLSRASFLPTCSLKDSTDEPNLGKTDLNVFLLPSTVCGRQHRLQEPEEKRP